MTRHEEIEDPLWDGRTGENHVDGNPSISPLIGVAIVSCGKNDDKKVPAPASSHKTASPVYDPYEFGNLDSASSFCNIYLYLILLSLGPALLCIPANFVAIGYVLGVGGILLTVFLYAYCMRIVVANEYKLCKRFRQPNMSYSEMARRAFECGPRKLRPLSKYVESTMNFLFAFVWLTGSSLMPILVAENLQKSIRFLFEYDVEVRVLLLWLAGPFILSCWIPKLKYLTPLSFVNNAVNIASICVVMWYTMHDLPPLGDRLAVGNVADLPLFVGVLLFSLNVTGIMLPLKSEMKRPKRFKARRGIITATYVTVAVVYSLFGFVCFLKYGDRTNAFAMRNLPETSFPMAVVGVYALGLSCVYPLSLYVPINVVWNLVLKPKMADFRYERKLYAEYACRTILPAVSLTIAYVVPNFDIFMLFTGTVGTSIDSLIIPALTEILIYYDQRKYALFAINGAIISIGATLFVLGSVVGVTKIIECI